MHGVARSLGALLAGALLAGGIPTGASGTFILEVRSGTGAAFPLPPEQYVYACALCTPADHAAVVPPAGHAKAAPKDLIPSTSATLPTPPAGVPGSFDLVPGIPGDDYFLGAEIVQTPIDLRGFAVDPAEPAVPMPLGILQVQRDTTFTFGPGTTLHVVTDDVGNDYVLFGFNLFLSDGVTPRPEDVTQVGALAGFPLPVGWTYDSFVLSQPFIGSSGGLATVYASGGVATWQRVTGLPEPSGVALMALGGLALVIRRRRVRS